MPEIGLFEAIYTQRALRRLKPDPVPDELLHKVIEAATKAPSGSNAQDWRFLVIRDPGIKEKVAQFYKRAWDEIFGARAARPEQLGNRIRSSAQHLAEHMAEAPVLILVCVQHHGGPSRMVRGASIYPAVQNLLLAARGLGLGSVLTTLHKRYEDEIKRLLGIPENVETAALLPLGLPSPGVKYGPNKRKPVQEVTYYNQWGNGA